MSVLGLTWMLGPCTTYFVMKDLSTSESTYYKSRAGTVYSVVERLIGFGLIEYVDGSPERDEKLIRVTDRGRTALKGWLTPPIPPPDIAHTADFIRARFFFLGILDPEERTAFIDDALAGLRLHLARCEDAAVEAEKVGGRFAAMAMLAIILETKARIEWLETVRDQVL